MLDSRRSGQRDATIFKARAAQLQGRLQKLAFFGFALPAAIGGIVLSFGTRGRTLPVFIAIASVLGVGHLVGTIWAAQAGLCLMAV